MFNDVFKALLKEVYTILSGRAMHPAQFTIYIAPCMIKSNTLAKLDFKKEASCGIMALSKYQGIKRTHDCLD